MMKLSPEQEKELERFPGVLQTLIRDELASGNSIVEIGHSWPAPPAGTYFKLARKVSSRQRASGGGIDFYDRHSSIYSGEFTDAKRFFFVLEPPDSRPPEPDMDAIRRAANGEGEPTLKNLAQVTAPEPAYGFGPAQFLEPTSNSEGSRPHFQEDLTATSAKWRLRFCDPRPPQDIQAQLERELMVSMPPIVDSARLVYRSTVQMTGALYSIDLSFDEALAQTNYYTLRIEGSWSEAAPKYHDYYRKTCRGWFNLWTRHFHPAASEQTGSGSAERYQHLCAEALKAEAQFASIVATQQSIITAMKCGGSFATAHKEGGTNIRWLKGNFVRSDYGESEDRQEFASEGEFLEFLRRFYHWETLRNSPANKVSEIEAWKLILRRLRTS